MEKGFYTALGTPFDTNGDLHEESYRKQVSDQIDAGASGLLIMGSMGMQYTVDNKNYAKVASVGVEEADSKCPVFVGVMDNSIARVVERINSLGDVKIDGVVATAPFYYTETSEAIMNFFNMIADESKYPLYLYDLPPVSHKPLNAGEVLELSKNNNIKGIKTANLTMIRQLMLSEELPSDFAMLYSGLDTFDMANKVGIGHNLDGMFACTPNLTSEMYKAINKNDHNKATDCLQKIIDFRNLFIKHNVFPSFTAAMNILGYAGRFHPDFYKDVTDKAKEEIAEYIGENNV